MGTCLRKEIVVLRKHMRAVLVGNWAENLKSPFLGRLKSWDDGAE